MQSQVETALPPEYKPLGPIVMMLLGLSVGVIGGYGAVVFRLMIGFFHNLLFYGTFKFAYDANVHAAPSAWGMGIILVPVVGALGVAWLVNTFAPEAKGHGVPEVIDAIYYNQGKIRPLVAFFKSIASALSIGSGGSVGREGPIIQIGSAFGSTLGQIIHMPVRQRITLIAAGAGAGIAATFNAPIGGVAFAVELLLVSVNAATLSVVAVATITAAYIGRYYLGLYPAFDIPALAVPDNDLTKVTELLLIIPFGVLTGFAATLFLRMIYWFEDHFEALPVNYYVRHMLGMSVMGIMMYIFMRTTGHYYVSGVGYATIVDILSSLLNHPGFLLLLFFAKLFATGLTLGSGASGGVFSPALYLGAALGAVFGNIAILLFPNAAINPIIFAVAGMAGMVSGSTGAVLTAITMLFEMTRDYNAILPIVLTVVLAYITRIMLASESIYTLKLLRRGHAVHEGLQAAINSAQRAQHVMCKDFFTIGIERLTGDDDILREPQTMGCPIIVERGGRVIGLLREGADGSDHNVDIKTNCCYTTADEGLLAVLRKMERNKCYTVFVMKHKNTENIQDLVGVITPKEVTLMAGRTATLMNETA